MPKGRSSEIRVRPVRKNKPDVRALARVLIELALCDAAKASAESEVKTETGAQGTTRPARRSTVDGKRRSA